MYQMHSYSDGSSTEIAMLKAQQPIRLKGKQMASLRARVFERDKGCVDAQVGVKCHWKLELSHDKPRSLGGEDTEENCHCRCVLHHRLRDLHGAPGHY